ncbi:putative phosphodiesterase [Bradyrhizobium sp. USDA 4341]
MKLWIVSDLHREVRKDWDPGRKRPEDFDVLILAGDVMDGNVVCGVQTAAAMAGGRPAIYVAGNHCHWGSSFEVVQRQGMEAGERTGVHFLQNTTIEIDGVVFFGATLWEPMLQDPRARRPNLSAIMSGMEQHPVPHGALPFGEPVHVQGPGVMDRRAKNRDVRRQFEMTRDALKAARPDVVVTHYPPTTTLLEEVDGIQLWIHGHEHRVRDEFISGTRVVDNAIGLPSERRMMENLCSMVIEVGPRLTPAP